MLLLARHGNTFEKGQIPRIVGARENPPLTEEGKEQARALGRALKDAGIRLDLVQAGPLSRTLEHAQLASAEAGYSDRVLVEPVLRELDFGAWVGLTDKEIAGRFGQSDIDAWRLDGRRPDNGGWTPAEQEVRDGLATLARQLLGNTLWVTSNGVLRYAMELDAEAFRKRGARGGFRVRTGNLCAFDSTPSGLRLVLWNELPSSDSLRPLADRI